MKNKRKRGHLKKIVREITNLKNKQDSVILAHPDSWKLVSQELKSPYTLKFFMGIEVKTDKRVPEGKVFLVPREEEER